MPIPPGNEPQQGRQYPPKPRESRRWGITLLLWLTVVPTFAADKVTLQLRWDHQFQFAGYYAAQWQGYYRQAGLEVEIRSAIQADGTILSAIDEVTSERTHFGIGSADILIARDQGHSLMVLASIFQSSAAAFYALAERPPLTPGSLPTLRVARRLNDLIDVELQALLRAEGIDPTQVRPYPHQPGLDHLTSGQVDVVPGYRISLPFDARTQGIELQTMLPAVYGVDFYGDSIFTHEDTVAASPDLVQRFVTASLKGWVYALEHSDEIARRISAELPHANHRTAAEALTYNQFQAQGVKQLTLHPVVRMGNVNPDRWARMHRLLKKAGIVSDDFDLHRVVHDPEWLRQKRQHWWFGLLMIGGGMLLMGILLVTGWSLALRRAVQQAVDRLEVSEQRFEITLRSIGDAVTTTDAEGIVQWLNPVAQRMTGWGSHEARGKSLAQVFHIVHEEDRQPAESPAALCLQQGTVVEMADHTLLISHSGEEFGIKASASPIRREDGQILGAVLIFHDVTEQRRLSREMSYRATHDALTGLVNRSEFEVRLRRVLESTHEGSSVHALLYIDLDQFKLVNDACGHSVGDLLLQQVSRLLSESIRTRDTFARLGGDEFGMILEHCSTDQAQRASQQICDRMEGFRFHHNGRRFRVGASIGLVPIDSRWHDTAAILQAADTACYAAKDAGRNRVHTWFESDHSMRQRHGEMQWATHLEQALDESRFLLHGQRICSLGDDAGQGLRFEVLLRLVEPDGSLTAPGAFLPAAERFYLASRIDRWVVRQVLTWLDSLPASTAIDTLTVNLSGQSIGDRTFHGFAVDALSKARSDIRRLCFEITETAAITNLADAMVFIQRMQRLGVRIALDDFGVGVSSFGYLRTLPVDYLKIDGRFIQGLIDNPLDRVTVQCFHEVARVVGVKTVAEFVEGEEVLEALREIGIDYAQGYLIHQPEPLGALVASFAGGKIF